MWHVKYFHFVLKPFLSYFHLEIFRANTVRQYKFVCEFIYYFKFKNLVTCACVVVLQSNCPLPTTTTINPPQEC